MEYDHNKEKAKKVLVIVCAVALIVALASLLVRKINERRGVNVLNKENSLNNKKIINSDYGYEFEYDSSYWVPRIVRNQEVLLALINSPESAENTESYAFGPHVTVSSEQISELIKSTSTEDYLHASGMSSSSEFFVSREKIKIGQYDFEKVVLTSAIADGQTVFYITFFDNKAYRLSMWPYLVESKDAQNFEKSILKSFSIFTSQGSTLKNASSTPL